MFGKLIRSSNGKFITLNYSIIILKTKRNYIITHIKHSYFTICLTYSIDCLGIRFTSNVGNHVKIIQGVVSQIYRFVSIVSFYNTKLSQNTNKGHTCANTKDYIWNTIRASHLYNTWLFIMEAKLSTNPLYLPFLEILDMVCLAINYWYHLAKKKNI